MQHERQVFFGVTLTDVKIKHPGDDGTLQPGAGSAQDIEAGSGKFGSLLKIQYAEFRTQIPVRFGRECEFGDLRRQS